MSSEAELATFIQGGHDIISFKMYTVGVTALWAYDYFLTLKDEVRYAWKTESVFVFVLFLLHRYLPGLFQVFAIFSMFYPSATTKMCRAAVPLESLYFAIISAGSQIVLAQRAYAITKKNKWVAGILYTIAAAQLGVGLYLLVWASTIQVEMSQIPLDAYHICMIKKSPKTFSIIQMSLSLSFDVLVFMFVFVKARLIRSTHQGVRASSILDTVSRDAEIYFVMVSTTHFLALVMFAATRPGLGNLFVVGSAVLVPMMISRMIISLKKAASSRRPLMSIEVPASGSPANLQDTHSHHAVENIKLSVFKS